MNTHIWYHETKRRLDPSFSIRKLRKRCPEFFFLKHRKERLTAYKGFVIASHWFVPSTGTPSQQVALYLWDAKRKGTLCVHLYCDTVRKAKALVDWLVGDRKERPKGLDRHIFGDARPTRAFGSNRRTSGLVINNQSSTCPRKTDSRTGPSTTGTIIRRLRTAAATA